MTLASAHDALRVTGNCGHMSADLGVEALSSRSPCAKRLRSKSKVERGHLIADDGVGSDRRHGRFPRAKPGFNRLVVIGHSGLVSLEALRWLHDVGVAVVQIDNDGELVLAAAPSGFDDARLRRAQAPAATNCVGLEISKDLISQKLAGQAEALRRVPKSANSVLRIRSVHARLDRARSVDELRHMEAEAALSYWQAWGSLRVRFPEGDRPRIPEHWTTFGVEDPRYQVLRQDAQLTQRTRY
jgi:hypothetical protein